MNVLKNELMGIFDTTLTTSDRALLMLDLWDRPPMGIGQVHRLNVPDVLVRCTL